MRIAFFCPSGPRHSTFLAYTQALLPILASEHEVTLVLGPAYGGQETPPLEGYPILSYEAWLAAPERFDVTFYQFGDRARLHGFMFEALRRQPGVSILHSTLLHQAVLREDLSLLDPALIRTELIAAYGPEGERAFSEVMAGRTQLLRYRSLLQQVLEQSLAIVATQEEITQEVARLCPPGSPIVCIPLPIRPERERCPFQSENSFWHQALAERGLILVPTPPGTPHEAALLRRAMEHLRHRWPRAVALVCEYEERMAHFAPSFFASEAVWWLSDLSHARRLALLAQARVAVFFASPGSRLEAAWVAQALAYGVPAIVVGAFDDSILRRVTLVIPREHPQNWGLLAAALDYMVTYPERLEALRGLGKRLALEHFGPERARRTLGGLLSHIKEHQIPLGTLWDDASRERIAIRETLSAMAGRALAELGLTPEEPLLGAVAGVIEGLVPPHTALGSRPFSKETNVC